MKRFLKTHHRLTLFILTVFFFYSCAEKKQAENTVLSQLTFSLDTLIIDSTDEPLYTWDGLWLSEISHDEKYLYNYNRDAAEIEKIDLEKAILVNKIKFEKDGPNGIGPFITNFSITSDNQFLMWYYGLNKIFNQNAVLSRDLALDNILGDDFVKNDIYAISIFEQADDANRFLGLYVRWSDRTYILIDFDLENQTYEAREITDLSKLKKYSVDLLYDGQMVGSMGTSVSAISGGNKILVSNNCFNEVYIFDMATDSLYNKQLDGVLLPKQKNYNPPKQIEIESKERYEVERKQYEDINYGNLLWDADAQRYLRLSYKVKYTEEFNEDEGYKTKGVDVYLSIFDADFNLMAESLVPELTKRPGRHFIKNGQLWIFKNIDDEVAFLRLSFK